MLSKRFILALVAASALCAAGCGSSDDPSFALGASPPTLSQAPSQRLLLLQQHEAVLLQSQAERVAAPLALSLPQHSELAALHSQRAQALAADRARLQNGAGSAASRFALEEEINSIDSQLQSLEQAKTKAREAYDAGLAYISRNPLTFPPSIYGRLLQQEYDEEIARLNREEDALNARRSFLEAELAALGNR